MGQAKARGTFEDRRSAARSRDAEAKRLREQEREQEQQSMKDRGGWAIPGPKTVIGRTRINGSLLLAAAIGSVLAPSPQSNTTTEDIEKMFK